MSHTGPHWGRELPGPLQVSWLHLVGEHEAPTAAPAGPRASSGRTRRSPPLQGERGQVRLGRPPGAWHPWESSKVWHLEPVLGADPGRTGAPSGGKGQEGSPSALGPWVGSVCRAQHHPCGKGWQCAQGRGCLALGLRDALPQHVGPDSGFSSEQTLCLSCFDPGKPGASLQREVSRIFFHFPSCPSPRGRLAEGRLFLRKIRGGPRDHSAPATGADGREVGAVQVPGPLHSCPPFLTRDLRLSLT